MISGGLPSGWEQCHTPQCSVYFIDHNTGTKTLADPRQSTTSTSPSYASSERDLRGPGDLDLEKGEARRTSGSHFDTLDGQNGAENGSQTPLPSSWGTRALTLLKTLCLPQWHPTPFKINSYAVKSQVKKAVSSRLAVNIIFPHSFLPALVSQPSRCGSAVRVRGWIATSSRQLGKHCLVSSAFTAWWCPFSDGTKNNSQTYRCQSRCYSDSCCTWEHCLCYSLCRSTHSNRR